MIVNGPSVNLTGGFSLGILQHSQYNCFMRFRLVFIGVSRCPLNVRETLYGSYTIRHQSYFVRVLDLGMLRIQSEVRFGIIWILEASVNPLTPKGFSIDK